jgi:hypothetical protein
MSEASVSCFLYGMDYYQPGCSYATMVGIWDNRTDSDASSWFTGLRGVVPSLNAPLECQLLCQNVTGCDFWSFEIESEQPEARCFLKAAYADANCGYSTCTRTTASALALSTSSLDAHALSHANLCLQVHGMTAAEVRDGAGPVRRVARLRLPRLRRFRRWRHCPRHQHRLPHPRRRSPFLHLLTTCTLTSQLRLLEQI